MRVAIVGASSDHVKFGNKALRCYLANGYEVIPVNPNEEKVENLKSFPDVNSIGAFVDRVLLYVPGKLGISVIEALNEKKVGEVIVNPGAEHPQMEEIARKKGIKLRFACAIVDIGDSPSRY